MPKKFSAQIDAWVRASKERQRAVLRESTQRLIDQSQTVGPSVKNPSGGEGGKMPVDTGFLRASMAVSFDGMPSGPGRGDADSTYQTDGQAVTLKLAGVEVGKTIYAGWVANYAVFMEERYGFMRSAAMNWQMIVDEVTKETKARFG